MTTQYEGNEKTIYTLNSNKIIALTDTEFNKLVVESETYNDMKKRYESMESELGGSNIEIIEKDNKIDELEDEVWEQKEEISRLKVLTSKIKQDDIDFIKNLSNEMNIQDTRGTAQPYALTLLTKHRDYIPNGYGDNMLILFESEEYETPQELAEYFDLEESYETFDDVIEIICSNNKYGEYSNNEFEELYYRDVSDASKHNANFFLTEKAYHKYIEANGHNLDSPSSYGIHLTRNDEMKQLVEIIHKLAKVLQCH